MNIDQDPIMAIADLVGRSGGTEFEIGWVRDPDDPEYALLGPGWYAHAKYGNERLLVENQAGPCEAADGLARRLLDGAQCTHCKKPVSLSKEDDSVCRWRRLGPRWAIGCAKIVVWDTPRT